MRSIRPGRSSASSSAAGMLVAIMTRIRYLGGGFGCMPNTRRTKRLTKPRGFFSRKLREQGLQRAHAAAAAPVHHPAHHLLDAAGSGSSGTSASIASLASRHCVSCDR